MSFYRTFIAIAAMGLASTAFAVNATHDATPNPTAAASQSASAQAAKINLNKATATELAQVKGLNPSKARAIVAYRKKNGDFKSVADLKEVRGFKRMDEKTLQDITVQLTIS